MMATTSSMVLGFVAAGVVSAVACAPPIPKVQQPVPVPSGIERAPRGLVLTLDGSFQSTVRGRSVITLTRHG